MPLETMLLPATVPETTGCTPPPRDTELPESQRPWVPQSRGRRGPGTYVRLSAVQDPEVSITGQGFCISAIIRYLKLPTNSVKGHNSSTNPLLTPGTLTSEFLLYNPGTCGSKQRGSGFVGRWAQSSLILSAYIFCKASCFGQEMSPMGALKKTLILREDVFQGASM